jgi:hypothetical protein
VVIFDIVYFVYILSGLFGLSKRRNDIKNKTIIFKTHTAEQQLDFCPSLLSSLIKAKHCLSDFWNYFEGNRVTRLGNFFIAYSNKFLTYYVGRDKNKTKNYDTFFTKKFFIKFDTIWIVLHYGRR